MSPFHPFPAQVLGGLGVMERDLAQRGPCSLFETLHPRGLAQAG